MFQCWKKSKSLNKENNNNNNNNNPEQRKTSRAAVKTGMP